MKKLIALVLLSVLVLTGCSGGKEALQDPEKEMEEAFKQLGDLFENIEKNMEEKEQKARDSAEVNKVVVEEYDDGKMEYNLRAYRYQDEFSYTKTGWATSEYTTSGKFLILELNVENIGKRDMHIHKGSLRALDEEYREYSAIVSLEENFDDDTRNIGPGFDLTFYIIYEVPSSFELAGFKFQQDGFSTDNYAIVDESQLGQVEKIFE